jgi:hypothetical protein
VRGRDAGALLAHDEVVRLSSTTPFRSPAPRGRASGAFAIQSGRCLSSGVFGFDRELRLSSCGARPQLQVGLRFPDACSGL